MKLYEVTLPAKIYEESTDGSTYFIVDHLDGMYSYCETEKGAVVHLGCAQPLVPFEDGYKFAHETDSTEIEE